ncbi:MAG: hypothetical protein HYT90_00740 [Candidatus Omnitrophica bacterium]|nr:hypothetical protein [Candidatus Omnitrophota bacterium]
MRHVVVFVHGIGEQGAEPPRGFEEAVRAAFERGARRQGKPAPGREALEWEYVYWADVTQPDQEELKQRLNVQDWLRGFLIGSMGDAVAYARLPYPPDKYGEIHERFAAVLSRILQTYGLQPDTAVRLTLIAHSLGTVIASDGMYEFLKRAALPPHVTFANVFTMGSPLALYALRYGLDRFTKPIRPEVWVNFYYPQDILGYPLKSLNAAYAEAVAEDVALRPAGGTRGVSALGRLVVAWLPGFGAWQSHGWYFSDWRLIERIGRTLAAQWTP